MTREEARYYLQSSGFSEEQMDTIEQAFTCEDAISRQAAIDAIYKMHMNGKEGVLHDLKTETGSDALFAETIADAVETLEELPSVNPQPKWDRLYSWLNDMRLGIAPDETTPNDERKERQAQVDVIDDIMEWMIEPQEREG